MSAANFHRQGRYRKTTISAKCPLVAPKRIIASIDLVIDSTGSNALLWAKKHLLKICLEEFEGSTAACARAMGVSPRSITNWIKEFGFEYLVSDYSKEFRASLDH